ncbi:MAG: DEAD/DEAH box helicase, partial [bacterium]
NWERIKEGVEEEINDLAQDLLSLYSNREDKNGYAYGSDSLEQTQFEASFPYRETPDQQEAIEAVKKDMESPDPMDRLICGDSGFGKTEVGLRAAFKAVSDGRQVAMLVPTTVLARQHYETFSNRFSIFPYSVELLSRFQTASETREIIENLKSGDTDIVVGTHRLLSDDIDFDDLGLLIIDEEQRFGVEQKETLKFYRESIDVLTLSATPIPRTLYMTLSGIQDISRINTPPEDRVPIEVDVGPFNPGEATEAIDREFNRGGQVFWVYNRVKDIDQRAEYVKSLYPEAEVAVAHGQMSKADLRETMNRFYDQEIDILVCTTIIESGLDCPTVNTMVVEEAHEFGLAQLYQLRGRVGRSHEQAYVKMFYPETVRLTDDAEARLQAIKQCSELGAGFNVAMRDLEIRGAGNILGKKQHGNIRAVGFPLYCRMLQREIRKLREEFEVPKPYPKLKLPGNYYIPEEYIPSEKQIIRQYQELSSCRTIQEVDELEKRWDETFGPLPDPVQAVLDRHKFKILADQFGWEDFRYSNNRLSMRYVLDIPQQLIDAARSVGARPTVRSDRLIVNSFPPDRIRDWIHESVSETEVAENAEVTA